MVYLYEKMYGGGGEGKEGVKRRAKGERKVDMKGMEMAVKEVSDMIEGRKMR